MFCGLICGVLGGGRGKGLKSKFFLNKMITPGKTKEIGQKLNGYRKLKICGKEILCVWSKLAKIE